GCRGEHLVLELRTALGRTLEVRLGERVDLLLGERGHVDLPIGRAHDLLELGAGDDVAHDGIEDVVEPRAGALLVAHRAQELQGIEDPPAGRRVDDDELAAESRDLADVAVPAEQALVEAAHLLDERNAPVQARLVDDAADRLAELHDDALLGLIDDEGRVHHDEYQRDGGERRYREVLHRDLPVLRGERSGSGTAGGCCDEPCVIVSCDCCGRGPTFASRRFSKGSGGICPSFCTTTTEPTCGSISFSVSRYRRERVTSGTPRYSASTAVKRAASPSARFTRSVA